jgi:hypothetical protein
MGIAILLLLPLLMSMLSPSDSDDIAYEAVDSKNLQADDAEATIRPIEPDGPNEIVRTGLIVPSDLFGANAVYSVHTDAGIPTDTFNSAMDAFEIDNIRFPAGQAELGPGDKDGFDAIDITQLTAEGDLRPELTSFMDRIDVDVTLTIPTTTPLSSYGDDLDTWAEMVMREYGDKISAFEIGNEYWSFMGETEYGQRANIAVQALARGIDAAGVEEADIIVQMASTYNESEYASSRSSAGFIDRLTAANNTIIDQFSTSTFAEIDGVVEHYYWNKFPIPFENNSGEINYMDVDFDVWQSRFSQDLDFHITEWNLKTGNCTGNGLRSMAIHVEMVENMVELGVDSAQVWPIVHNTTNDLGGPADDGVVETDAQGRVVETVRGAIFDLMSEALPGTELIKLDIESVENGMEIAAYESDGDFVFYFGSNSTAQENFTVDLREIIPDFSSAEGVQIGYDRATSDGQIWGPNKGRFDALSVQIDGETYYLNEHDTRAELTDFVYRSPVINVSLNPYEVIQITAR